MARPRSPSSHSAESWPRPACGSPATPWTSRSSITSAPQFSLLIGERTAEELKISVGSAFPVAGPQRAEIRGRDIGSGLPRNVTVSGDELRKAMDPPINRIIGAIRSTLDRCPPELSGDLVSRGIVLTGGGALLRGLAARVQHEIGIPVLVADRPLDSVVLGTGTVVEHFEQLQKVVVDGPRR